MGYPLQFALRYLSSKKRASISVGTAFAILGVALGVAALATIMSVTGGFHTQFREKVLGVNAHVLVLKYSTNFREYREVMRQTAKVPGVIGVAPFSINPMMLTHGDATATGVLVKGVDPRLSLGAVPPHGDEWGDQFPNNEPVLDLPKYVVEGSLEDLRRPNAKPARGKYDIPPPAPDLFLPPPLPSGSNGALDDLREAIGDAASASTATPAAPTSAATPSPAPLPSGALPLPPDPKPDPGSFLGGGRLAPDEGNGSASSKPAQPMGPGSKPTPPDGKTDGSSGGGGAAAAARAGSGGAGGAPPRGNVEPDSGYSSELPEDDDLPDDIDPDPCENPEAIKDLPGIVVGKSLAKTLDLELGECLTVTSPTIGFTFASGQIKPPVAKRFRVVAMFEAGFDQYDSKLVYTDLYEAQTFYDHGDTVTGVEMKVRDIEQASAISDRIAGELSSGMYHTMDWMELNHGLFTALQIQQWAMSGVLALIIIVAAFTVIATLIMVVLDKQKEISVLKAMGATDWAILRIFLYQGGIIGLLGTGLGLLLAYGVCKGLLVYGFPLDPKVYFVSRLPVQVRPQEFLITGAVALLICLVATIIPSLYAASLRPADGFRNN